MFNFYLAEYNPTGLSEPVGGAISSIICSGYWSELFTHVTAPPSGADEFTQYRKVFIKNEYLTDKTQTRVWLDSVEHSNQISLSLASGNDSFLTATGFVSGYSWSTPSNYTNGIQIGTLSANSSTGIWIKQTLTGIAEGDAYASFRLYIGGI